MGLFKKKQPEKKKEQPKKSRESVLNNTAISSDPLKADDIDIEIEPNQNP